MEKPDLDTAKTYLASGQYSWNSGMFMFQTSTVLDELAAHAPAIVAACRNALDSSRQDLDFLRLDADAFSASPSDSIDYAVMEKTDIGAVIPFADGWNDLEFRLPRAGVCPFPNNKIFLIMNHSGKMNALPSVWRSKND
ncbi:MAG: hypothetical protein LC657_01805 [Desulfobacteraceae bacterium]|nr:hypothetical protein [Desulfobacteraceae bacterium]